MKDIFQESDFQGITQNPRQMANIVNALIDERFRLEKCKFKHGSYPLIQNGFDGNELTHYIRFITEPFVAPEPKCDHKFIVLNMDKFFEKKVEKLNIHNFCPKCGDNLQGDNS